MPVTATFNYVGPHSPDSVPQTFALPEHPVQGHPNWGINAFDFMHGIAGTTEHAPVVDVSTQGFAQQPAGLVTGQSRPVLENRPTDVKGGTGIPFQAFDWRTWYPGVMSIFSFTRTPGAGTTESGGPDAQRWRNMPIA